MKSKKFDDRIKPIMDLVEKLCEEEGINFLAQFNLDDGEIYHYVNGDMILDGATIMSQYQKWAVHNNLEIKYTN